MTCALIACTYRERLWCWDFVAKQTQCVTDKIMVSLEGKTVTTKPRPAHIGEFRLVELQKPEKESENA